MKNLIQADLENLNQKTNHWIKPTLKMVFSPIFASFFNRLLLYPIETVITLQQKDNVPAKITIQNLYKSLGFFGFYKGITYPLIMGIPSKIATYGVYYAFQDKLLQQNRFSIVTMNLISGTVLGCIDAILICPVEYLRIRTIAGLQTQYKLANLYRGFIPGLINGILGGTIILAGSDYIKSNLPKKMQDHHFSSFIAGSFSGATYLFLSTPIEVLKTKIITSDLKRSLWFYINSTVNEKALFSGLLLRYLRGGLSVGLTISLIKITNQAIDNVIPNIPEKNITENSSEPFVFSRKK
ncbi:MAG: hypothetical protein JSS53_07580 [Proteobacteria bacterium]|nr:hypothetical protein [Pseudomonadota bacterium]